MQVRATMRDALKVADKTLSERDRTRGRKESISSTNERYLGSIPDIVRAEMNALRDSMLAQMPELVNSFDSLQIEMEEVLSSSQSSQLVKQLAVDFALEDELQLDQRILCAKSLTKQVDNICSSLASRTELCNVCLSVSQEIAACLHGKGTQWTRGVDQFWPKRDLRDNAVAAFMDGPRLLPPESVNPGDTLPSNVIRHHPNAGSVLESAKDCPFCELLRLAIILDSSRKYD